MTTDTKQRITTIERWEEIVFEQNENHQKDYIAQQDDSGDYAANWVDTILDKIDIDLTAQL